MKPLVIGDKVRIIGPDIHGYEKEVREDVIRTIDRNNDQYYANGWYPVSSLELVEDLKIGDEVEVVGPGKHGNTCQIGDKFIISKTKEGYYSDSEFAFWYPASSLRKIEKPDRLAAIESRLLLSEQCNANICTRLHDLEAGQKEQENFNRLHVHPCCAANPESPVVAKILDEPEIQAGDWVQVVVPRYIENGKVFKIVEQTTSNGKPLFSAPGMPFFWRAELRKLSDEEIAKRLNGGQA